MLMVHRNRRFLGHRRRVHPALVKGARRAVALHAKVGVQVELCSARLIGHWIGGQQVTTFVFVLLLFALAVDAAVLLGHPTLL